VPRKRAEPPLTPAASVDGSEKEKERDVAGYFNGSGPSSSTTGAGEAAKAATEGEGSGSGEATQGQEPPKKKRRVALTRVGDLE